MGDGHVCCTRLKQFSNHLQLVGYYCHSFQYNYYKRSDIFSMGSLCILLVTLLPSALFKCFSNYESFRHC